METKVKAAKEKIKAINLLFTRVSIKKKKQEKKPILPNHIIFSSIIFVLFL